MARRSGAAGGAALAGILLVASTLAVLMSRPTAALSDEELTLNATVGSGGGGGGKLAFDYHAVSCPHLVTIVRAYVQTAVRGDATITPGLLRIHFHDCFPQGCDASILLAGPSREWGPAGMPANANLNLRAMQLIERIRAHVHAVCGATVSCADITAVATSEAVYASGGPLYGVPLGQMDSFAPAHPRFIGTLPAPSTADVNRLHGAFCGKGLCDLADLVALSGAHTVGYAHCPAFQDRRQDDAFGQQLQMNCRRNPSWAQILDMFTPYRFDNGYFFAVFYGNGVLTSDMALRGDPRTAQLVRAYAGNQAAFFQQFARSMQKLSYAPKPQGNVGEIRRFSCFRSNNGRYGADIADVTVATADEVSAGATDNVVDVSAVADEGSAGATASA
uniref:Peroxidase n=1 Tax=Oryza punctata TaxID=4537 RepID=A0A0E0KHN7_ORYPU